MFKLQGFIEGGVRQDEGLKPPTQISWGYHLLIFSILNKMLWEKM